MKFGPAAGPCPKFRSGQAFCGARTCGRRGGPITDRQDAVYHVLAAGLPAVLQRIWRGPMPGPPYSARYLSEPGPGNFWICNVWADEGSTSELHISVPESVVKTIAALRPFPRSPECLPEWRGMCGSGQTTPPPPSSGESAGGAQLNVRPAARQEGATSRPMCAADPLFPHPSPAATGRPDSLPPPPTHTDTDTQTV